MCVFDFVYFNSKKKKNWVNIYFVTLLIHTLMNGMFKRDASWTGKIQPMQSQKNELKQKRKRPELKIAGERERKIDELRVLWLFQDILKRKKNKTGNFNLFSINHSTHFMLNW